MIRALSGVNILWTTEFADHFISRLYVSDWATGHGVDKGAAALIKRCDLAVQWVTKVKGIRRGFQEEQPVGTPAKSISGGRSSRLSR